MLTIAFLNRKPGTGKTTSSVWLAHAYMEMGLRVLLVDADPGASALEWADRAGGFPFRTVGLPKRDLQTLLPDFTKNTDIAILDCPQVEDHAPIARGAMLVADEIIVPMAPAPIELSRALGTRDDIAKVSLERLTVPRSAVLLNRTVANALSTTEAREALQSISWDVLENSVPRLELFAQSFGGPVYATASTIWVAVANELLERQGHAAAKV